MTLLPGVISFQSTDGRKDGHHQRSSTSFCVKLYLKISFRWANTNTSCCWADCRVKCRRMRSRWNNIWSSQNSRLRWCSHWPRHLVDIRTPDGKLPSKRPVWVKKELGGGLGECRKIRIRPSSNWSVRRNRRHVLVSASGASGELGQHSQVVP